MNYEFPIKKKRYTNFSFDYVIDQFEQSIVFIKSAWHELFFNEPHVTLVNNAGCQLV